MPSRGTKYIEGPSSYIPLSGPGAHMKALEESLAAPSDVEGAASGSELAGLAAGASPRGDPATPRLRWARPATVLLTGAVAAALATACSYRGGLLGRQSSEGLGAGSDVAELAAVHCHTAQPSDACHSDVNFVKTKFLKEHPDWYKGLTAKSSFKDIQAYLSTQKTAKGKPRCPWPCDYTPPSTTLPPAGKGKEGEEGSCHTAKVGEDCFNHVKYTRKAVEDHPTWYGGLTKDSDFKDIQNYLHEEVGSVCPRPCNWVEDKVKSKSIAGKCATAVKGEKCFDAIHWVRTKGYKKHPEWFKGISETSTPEEVQNYLAGKNGSHCSLPACHCHTAQPGEDCYTHVSFTIKALPKHPDWYPGLTEESTVKEVQAFMHGETTGDGKDRKKVCPMPCGLLHDKLDKEKHRCHTAIAGEACYDQVLWAMGDVEGHPEWYPGLNKSSSFEDFQALMHLGKKDDHGKHCPIPCDEDANALANKSKAFLNCHIAQKGEPCWDSILEAYEDIKKHPKRYEVDGLSPNSTFEDVQTYLRDQPGSHCDQMPCLCKTAVEGEKCFENVDWVLDTGLKTHKDRFSMISKDSSREEIQLTLHAEKKYKCLLPCTPPWDRL